MINNILERLNRVTSEVLVQTNAGDVRVRLPNQASYSSLAIFWQGTDSQRARVYADFFAHAANDMHQLFQELTRERNERQRLERELAELRELIAESSECSSSVP